MIAGPFQGPLPTVEKKLKCRYSGPSSELAMKTPPMLGETSNTPPLPEGTPKKKEGEGGLENNSLREGILTLEQWL